MQFCPGRGITVKRKRCFRTIAVCFSMSFTCGSIGNFLKFHRIFIDVCIRQQFRVRSARNRLSISNRFLNFNIAAFLSSKSNSSENDTKRVNITDKIIQYFCYAVHKERKQLLNFSYFIDSEAGAASIKPLQMIFNYSL